MNNYKFEKIIDGIFVLKFPFEDVFTTVFALTDNKDTVIIDSGTTETDVTDIIIPAIQNGGFKPTYIVCTHSHSDHAGGMPYLRAQYPKAEYTDAAFGGGILLNRYRLINLSGHADDCVGVYDTKEKVLLSGDAIQQYGVGKFKTHITDKAAYLKTLETVEGLNPKMIICSHNYEPCGMIIKGESKIKEMLKICERRALND